MPFSTEQIAIILQTFKENKFSIKEFKSMLERFVDVKAKVKNGKEWYGKISEILATFLII